MKKNDDDVDDKNDNITITKRMIIINEYRKVTRIQQNEPYDT